MTRPAREALIARQEGRPYHYACGRCVSKVDIDRQAHAPRDCCYCGGRAEVSGYDNGTAKAKCPASAV